MSSWHSRLEALARAHGLDDAQAEQLAAVVEVVGGRADAPTTVRDRALAVERHVADSLAGLAVPEVRAARRLLDLGSGAGFPGLPLAVALPEAEVALVESVARKCAFLRDAVQAVGLRNASVACTRIEQWSAGEVDVVCARAVAPLAVLVEYAAPVLRLEGTLVAWKGAPARDEERAGDSAAAIVGLRPAALHEVPPQPSAERRRLYVYRKGEPTPARFPRRPGMARKRPLAKCNKSATTSG